MLLAVFSALCISAYSQITVTSATFPAQGDTLHFATDNAPAGINVATPPGGNQLWDLTGLQVSSTNDVIYRPASAGMNSIYFPGADLVVIGPTTESYYNVTNNKVDLLGYAGADPALLGINVLAKYAPPFTVRKAPLMFFDISNPVTNLTLPFSIAQLPDTLLQGFSNIVDSIRFRLTFDRLEVVDGWGTCQIPGGSYPVLRQKQTEYVSRAIDVHVFSPIPLGWVDLATFLPAGSGGPLASLLGTDTTLSYHFISGTEKEEIAVATLNNDQATIASVQFKNNMTTDVDDHSLSPGSANIQAHPNPAVEWVRFDCTNLPQDEYTLKIFNIVGKVVWKDNFALAGNKSIKLQLEEFKKGTYLYSLLDSKGNTIGTKRLVVLKP